jgi:ABC-type glutathione transport system ATPase component
VGRRSTAGPRVFGGVTIVADGTEVLRIEGIHKAFGSFVALQSIDLTISEGEMVCFVGPSGCGKTTLLRIIAGLEEQTRGRVVQKGRDVSHAPPSARDYGIVFQSYALFPNLTIDQNVAYGLVNRRKSRGEIKSRVQELLSLVGLPGEGRKYPGSCRAASSSASRSPGRSRRRRRCSSSTSRCPPSTRRCASGCAARYVRFSDASRSRRSW